jgi:hypothetical protein
MTLDSRQDLSKGELDMFVIDVLHYDIEDTEAILRMLNNSGPLGWRTFSSQDFTREEVLIALDRLIREGFVRPLEYDPVRGELVDMDRPVDVLKESSSLWFKLKELGLDLWNSWKSPKEELG